MFTHTKKLVLALVRTVNELFNVLVNEVRSILLHPVAAVGDVLDGDVIDEGGVSVGHLLLQEEVIVAPDHQRGHLNGFLARFFGFLPVAEHGSVVVEGGRNGSGLGERVLEGLHDIGRESFLVPRTLHVCMPEWWCECTCTR